MSGKRIAYEVDDQVDVSTATANLGKVLEANISRSVLNNQCCTQVWRGAAGMLVTMGGAIGRTDQLNASR